MKNQNSKPKVILHIGRMRNRVAEPFLERISEGNELSQFV